MGAAFTPYPVLAATAPGDPATAVARGDAVAAAQRDLGLLVEPAVHAWASGVPGLVAAATVFYLVTHVPALVGALVWAWWSRPAVYVVARDTFLVAQVLTIACYLRWPTAPPRLVPSLGMADTLTGLGGPGAADAAHALQHPYAAVPSGHVVFALVAAATVAAVAGSALVRRAAVAYPFVVVAATMVTAHHFLFDAVVAAAVALIAWGMVLALRGRPWRPVTARSSTSARAPRAGSAARSDLRWLPATGTRDRSGW